jgi:inorganic pyrophosphatase
MMSEFSITMRVEIPAFSSIKYEIDKKTGHMIVDRFLKTALCYPCNYGYIPETLAGDGDELDGLIITPSPIAPGMYIACRPIGTLGMIDEKGEDTKVLAVPVDTVTTRYQMIQTIEDLERFDPEILKALRHFFEHYKDLDESKWVKLQPGWGSVTVAQDLIQQAADAYRVGKQS